MPEKIPIWNTEYISMNINYDILLNISHIFMTYHEFTILIPQKSVELNHSLTQSLTLSLTILITCQFIKSENYCIQSNSHTFPH